MMMECKAGQSADKCPMYHGNGGVHCFAVRQIKHVSDFITKLALAAITTDEDCQDPEMEGHVSSLSAMIIALLASVDQSLLWDLAGKFLELLSCKGAKRLMGDSVTLPAELGEFIAAYCERQGSKPTIFRPQDFKHQ